MELGAQCMVCGESLPGKGWRPPVSKKFTPQSTCVCVINSLSEGSTVTPLKGLSQGRTPRAR